MSLRRHYGPSARSSIRRSIRKRLKGHQTHEKLKDPTKFDAPDSDEEAWVDELFIKRASLGEITYRIKNNLFRSKEYIYQINVQWNIGKETIIYRSYEDFFRMQMHLLDYFGEDPEDPERRIPFLPGKRIWRINNRKLAQHRQPGIQLYVDDLLKLPFQVSRCNEVLDFFRFRKTDPKQVLVPVPDDLVCKPRPRNENFLRSSFRRSFKKVRSKLQRTQSLRSMTDEERAREDNDNYDVEPTTSNFEITKKELKEKYKVSSLQTFLQVSKSFGPPGMMSVDMYDALDT